MKTRTVFKQRTARFIKDPMTIPKIRRDIKRREGAVAAIAMKGDMFWNNGRTREFSTAQGLQEGYKTMDKTFHDLDHGANPQQGIHIRIEDIVGFHDYTEYNPSTKEMVIYIYPEENMEAYNNWRAFMDLCDRAGKNPNVSVEYMSTDEQQKASELGDLVDYKAAGFKDDDLIWVERSYRFLGAATVNIGACNDTDGCGIVHNNNDMDVESRIGEHEVTADTDTDVDINNDMEKKNMTNEENKSDDNIADIAVKDRKIEVLKEQLQDCGKLRGDLELKLESMETRIKALEPEPVVVDEEQQALENRNQELEEQLKEAEEKLSKPVSRKTTSDKVDHENTGIKALRWFAHNKIGFNTQIKGE